VVLCQELRGERQFVFDLQRRRALDGVLHHRAQVEGECTVLPSGRQLGRFRSEPLIKMGRPLLTAIGTDHATSRPIDHVSRIAACKVNKVPDCGENVT